MALDNSFDEIAADVRHEQMAEYFRKNLPFFVGLVVFMIAATAGFSIYHNWQDRVAGRESAEIIRLNNQPAAIANADALRDYASRFATGKRKSLGYLLAAAKYSEVGKMDEANKIYAHVATLNSGARELDAYAQLAAVQHLPDAKLPSFDKNSPWHLAQLELQALQAKTPDDMKKLYAQIAAAPDTPLAMRQRAEQFAGTVTKDAEPTIAP